MSERLALLFRRLKQRQQPAMGLFLTSGFPHPEASLPLLHTLAEAGADFLELGMPFSDPLAEGKPIQRASEVALAQGITMQDTLQTVARFRTQSEVPLLLMGYYNPILRYGIKTFCMDAKEAGVDGLIIADLPPEEAGELHQEATAAGLAMVYLIAPNTPDERIRTIDTLATGFVYAVSVTGLTGSSIQVQAVEPYLQRARRHIQKNPLLVGFGIKSPEDARRLSAYTDGYIVGSALIQKIENLWQDAVLSEGERLQSVREFVRYLKVGGHVSHETSS